MRSPPTYVLGSDDPEIARLDGQAAALEPATELLLRAAGLDRGMRVLELGTGLGHVAFHVAQMVGPEGSVVAVDQADRLLEVAEARRRARGLERVRFTRADARDFRDAEPFDAVVARLLLFHLPGALDVLRHHRGALRPGGTMVALDVDNGSARAEPPVPLVTETLQLIEAAFRGAGADPRVGARLAGLLRGAGYTDVGTLGIQGYLQPDARDGPVLLAGVVRALAGPIVAMGLAREDELGLDTLEERLVEQQRAQGAVVLPPALVGAWGRAPSDGG